MDRRFVQWTDADGHPIDGPGGRRACSSKGSAIRSRRSRPRPLRAIVLVTHILPFRSLVPPVFVDGHLKFFRAFLGSTRLGELALTDPRITISLSGHVHSVRTSQEGRIRAFTCPTGYPRERKPGETAASRRLLLDV